MTHCSPSGGCYSHGLKPPLRGAGVPGTSANSGPETEKALASTGRGSRNSRTFTLIFALCKPNQDPSKSVLIGGFKRFKTDTVLHHVFPEHLLLCFLMVFPRLLCTALDLRVFPGIDRPHHSTWGSHTSMWRAFRLWKSWFAGRYLIWFYNDFPHQPQKKTIHVVL